MEGLAADASGIAVLALNQQLDAKGCWKAQRKAKRRLFDGMEVERKG